MSLVLTLFKIRNMITVTKESPSSSKLHPNQNWDNISDRYHDEKFTMLTWIFGHKCTLYMYNWSSFNVHQTCYSVGYFSYFYGVLQKFVLRNFRNFISQKDTFRKINWISDSNSITYRWNISTTSAFGSD